MMHARSARVKHPRATLDVVAAWRSIPAALLLLLALAGCATAPPAPAPLANGVVPDLRGTWTGTWAGAPLTLVVTDQHEVGASGVYLGTWQVLGGGGPGLSGVLTFTIRGERLSVPVVGRLGSNAGRLALVLYSSSSSGEQYLQLAEVAPGRLHGTGESSYAWGPRGAAQLQRVAVPAR